MALVGVWLLGFVRFMAAHGEVEQTLPRLEPPPAGEHNLVAYRFGPRVRASSYHRDQGSHHHPVFMVDEQASPSLAEKWVSAFDDPAPWLELHWREPRDVSRVVLRLAGQLERAALNMRAYTLRCLGSAREPALVVRDNRDSEVRHALPCRGATGLRAEFTLGRDDDRTRIFELEVWGR